MVAQQTVLTIDTTLDRGFTYPFHEARGKVSRILLPADWRKEALTSLAAMGITAASLFPGVQGIGDYTTMLVRLGQDGLRADVERGL